MKKLRSILIIIASLSVTGVFCQKENDLFWTPVNEPSIRLTGARQIVPKKFITASLKGTVLRDKLFSAPLEKNSRAENSECVISLPLPNGTIQRFRVSESPVMAEELAAAFPDIKTFSVKGLDDVHATGKIDWNEFGFHARILSVNGDFYIDPYCVGNRSDYISYYTFDFEKDPSQKIEEVMPEGKTGSLDLLNGQKKPGVPFYPASKTTAAACVGAQLRTYRLVIACTGEYAKAATGLQAPTVAQALAKIVTSVNRVNLVYEKEVSVRLVLVPTETMVVFTDPATDPFNGNNNANTLISESQTVITSTIGSGNFDIGHTFSTGGGGLAYMGVVCSNPNKARGITGSSSPVGDPYDIDYVAHEIGHQFNGSHTFNAITGNCNGNRNPATSVEPGSGVTIMGYAGICGSNDLASHSIANFHAVSYDEIVNYTNSGNGNSCPVITSTGNNPPVVTVDGDFTIPKGTPFVLTGSATDVDGDKLYYSWEETDNGANPGDNWNSGSKPYFRSYVPDSIAPSETSYSRFFPKKSVVLSGNYTGTKGEYLPQAAQILKFRLTARDNKTGGGGVCSDIMNLTIYDSGPFTVTYPSLAGITWSMGTQQMVTWDVNGTDQPPVSCDSVRILISYDSGNNYNILVNSAPNTGYLPVTAPVLPLTISTCRIKVEAKGNIFYDIGNNNFTLTNGTPEITVGIKQVSQVNTMGLVVWPNPFTGKLNFSVANLNAGNDTEVKVMDVLGKTFMALNYSGKAELNETLDLSGLTSGIYFIKVTNNNNQSVYRIIKD